MNYSKIAFSDAAKKLQEKAGSRVSYARMDGLHQPDTLTHAEVNFISQRDSFYMATVGKNGFPYVQFRGGPKGFLKVLDDKRLGFIDFRGNMQFISIGNLKANTKVSIILVDYPARTRLKIFSVAEIVELKDNPDLLQKLNLSEYKFRPERMLIFNIKAYNWNCPQHITPRYTLEEIEESFQSQQNYIVKLEQEVKDLKAK